LNKNGTQINFLHFVSLSLGNCHLAAGGSLGGWAPTPQIAAGPGSNPGSKKHGSVGWGRDNSTHYQHWPEESKTNTLELSRKWIHSGHEIQKYKIKNVFFFF